MKQGEPLRKRRFFFVFLGGVAVASLPRARGGGAGRVLFGRKDEDPFPKYSPWRRIWGMNGE